jgi:hypothetical protein
LVFFLSETLSPRPPTAVNLFETVADLVRGLETISRDGDVRIARVTNRLRADYDPAITAGYRDVALNLQLDQPETRRLGLEAHVCEVQLILVDFARLKVRSTSTASKTDKSTELHNRRI